MTTETRRTLAVVLALLATVFVLIAVLAPIRSCDNVIADGSIVELCSRPSLEALAFSFLPALILLLPDIGEVSFLGITAKRIAEQSAEKADKAQAVASEAKLEASTVKQTTATVGAAVLSTALSEARGSSAVPPVEDEIDLPTDRDALVEHLLHLWKDRLRPYERLARRSRYTSTWPALREHVAALGTAKTPSVAIDCLDRRLLATLPPGLTDQTIEEIKRWDQTYQKPLDLVELTAATTAAATHASNDEEIREAIQLGEAARRALPQPARDYVPG